MARPLRIQHEGAFYHVTSRGNERKRIFFSKADYDRFKTYLEEAREKYAYRLHCYVLMPNHYHLLIETPGGNLSKVMHYINGSYTNYINRRKGRTGHLFQGRYKAILVDKDNYLLELSRYVHLNPVRAGIVERPEAYPYSSYKSFIQKEGEEIVYRDLILAMLASDPALARSKYRTLAESAISEELESPLKDVYGGAILGGENFIRKTLGRLKDETLSKEEVSSRRELQKSMGAEEILKIVSHHLGISIEDLAVQKDDKRDLTIYLLKKYTGLTNRRIGDLFGGLSYSAVAKVYARFPEKAEKDSALGKLLAAFSLSISNFKG